MNIHIYNEEPVFSLGVVSYYDENIVELVHNITGGDEEKISEIILQESPKYEKGEPVEFFFTKNDQIFSIIVVFLEEQKIGFEPYRRAASDFVKYAESCKKNDFVIALSPEAGKNFFIEKSSALFEGALLSTYKYDKYKSNKKTNTLEELYFYSPDKGLKGEVEKGFSRVRKICEKVFIARDLVNTPANDLIPLDLAEAAKDAAENWGFEIEVIEESQIYELGMGAYLSVSRASVHEPYLIVMKYNGDLENPDKKVGLVGKGLTYDTGGLSLKPSKSMDTMKLDMGGAAAVIAVLSAAAELKLKANIVGVVAACENALSGDAYRPGDIVKTMSGKTIEVINTDAEGRLTLADALHFVINNEKVDCVIDIATLTGAAIVGLGAKIIALLGNDDTLCSILEDASAATGEKICRLPLEEDYKELLKTEFADIKNVGNREGGAITAGLFLQEFVGDTPWAHLDIAGPVWDDKIFYYNSPGATGSSVRLLLHSIEAVQKSLTKKN